MSNMLSDATDEDAGNIVARRWHSTNLVGVPTELLASALFNDHPVRLRIAGVREMNKSLFEMLADATTQEEEAEAFESYVAATFGLEPELREARDVQGRRRYRSSYRRLLKGWGYDSSGPEGAVLKGWVESRFGLLPTYHKQVIQRISSEAWAVYVAEKMSSRFHNNAIQSQLDILYEYCQWNLARHLAGRRHITLYRGVNDFAEHPVIRKIDKRTAVVRLNNLVSFASDRAVAECFGDYILEAHVPSVKILFHSSLLPLHPLQGENEYLVIGGDYRVTAGYF